MSRMNVVYGRPSRSADWTFVVEVDGEKRASGFATRRSDVEREAVHYGWKYADEGDCIVTIRPPSGLR